MAMAQNHRCLSPWRSCRAWFHYFIDTPPNRNPQQPRLQTPQMTCSDKGGTPSSIACTSAGKLQASQPPALYQVVSPPPGKLAWQCKIHHVQDVFPIENMDVPLLCWFSGVELRSGKADFDFSPFFPRSCTEIAIALGAVGGDLGCLPRKGGMVHCWVKEAMKPGNLEARLEEQNVFVQDNPQKMTDDNQVRTLLAKKNTK